MTAFYIPVVADKKSAVSMQRTQTVDKPLCKYKIGFGAKPQARSQGRQPPIISPFPRGRGLGMGIERLFYV